MTVVALSQNILYKMVILYRKSNTFITLIRHPNIFRLYYKKVSRGLFNQNVYKLCSKLCILQ